MTTVLDFNCNDSDDEDKIILKCLSNVSWSLFGLSQVWSLVAWVTLSCACLVLRMRWNKIGVPTWVDHYVGSSTSPPADIWVDVAVRVTQLASSTFIVFAWIYKSYTLGRASDSLDHSLFAFELAACVGCLAHLCFRAIKSGFHTTFVTSSEVVLDCFTLTPLLLQRAGPTFGGTFVTVSYLRMTWVLSAYDDLANGGFLEPYLSDMSTALMRKFIEFLAVTFTIAGTFWVLEGLGDLPFLHDSYIGAGMGEISFLQMCYFTFITMSTVGYGDYSPTTIPGRLFTFVAVLGGVTFFSIASSELIELQRLESSGRGRYRPSKHRGKHGHILIVGGGVDSGSAPIIESFLQALCRDSTTPDIVLLGSHPCTPEVSKVLHQLERRGFEVKFFVGQSMSEDDLRRVRADLATFAFVLCDFNSPTPLDEDESNILLAGALQNFRPSLPYRLMLCEDTELELAHQLGLDPLGCFALSELKADLLAGSLRAPGLSTLIVNLCLKNIPPPEPHDPPISPWLQEFIVGADLEIYGFQPRADYRGRTFGEVAAAIAATYNVIVIAMQVDGAVELNPRASVVDDTSILFAISADANAIDVCALNGDSDKRWWQDLFRQNREEVVEEARRRTNWGKSEVMGKTWSQWRSSVAKHQHHDGPKFRGFNALPSVGTLTTLEDVVKRAVASAPTPPGTTFTTAAAAVTTTTGSSSGGVSSHGGAASGVLQPLKERFAEELLREVVGAGQHTVVCVLGTGESQRERVLRQLEIIVSIVRSTHATPLVVIAHPSLRLREQQPSPASELAFNSGDASQVYLVEGDPKRMPTLVAAGVEKCESFMTLAPTAPPSGAAVADDGGGGGGDASSSSSSSPRPSAASTMMDRQNLLACGVLEHHLEAWGRTDLAPLYDWYHPDSVKFMMPPPSPFQTRAASLSTRQNSRDRLQKATATKTAAAVGANTPLSSSSSSSSSFCKKAFAATPSSSLPASKVAPEDAPPATAAPSTAAISDLPPSSSSSSSSSLLVDGLNNLLPGDMKFAQSVDIRGHYRFAAGRVLPKPMISSIFSMAFYTPGVMELLEAFVSPVKMSQKVQVWVFPVPKVLAGKAYRDVAKHFFEDGAIPIGVLRGKVGPLPYVVAKLPLADTVVDACDALYVLADLEWAEQNVSNPLPSSNPSSPRRRSLISELASAGARTGANAELPPLNTTPGNNKEPAQQTAKSQPTLVV